MLNQFYLDWRTEPSMMLSGYTPTSSSTESSKHVSHKTSITNY